MLERFLLPSRCPPIVHPSRRLSLALHSSINKTRRAVAILATQERALVTLDRHHGPAASLRARNRSAEPSNESKQEWRVSFPANQATPVSDSISAADPRSIRKRRWCRAFPLRSCILLPRQRSRETGSQSQLQDYGRVRRLKFGWRWRISQNGIRRRRGGSWFRRLHLTQKPLRPGFRSRPAKRLCEISLGGWPNDTKWGGHQIKRRSLETINWDWVLHFPTLEIPDEMQNWTCLDTDRVIGSYRGLSSGKDPADDETLELQGSENDRLWQNVMLWCLKHQRRKALTLLLVTYRSHRYRPLRYVVSDSLKFLARYFLHGVASPNSMIVDAVWFLTCKFMEGASDQDEHFAVPQQLIYLVLRHSDDLRVLSLYSLIDSNKAVLHIDTMLHFVNKFVDGGRINLSMRLLATIVNAGFDRSYHGIQMACVKLLRARFDPQIEYNVRSTILTQILEMGVRPNIQMFNTILLNAGEGGDFANAWQMYGLAKDNALIPNSITYNVLLKGAELSGESSNLEMVLREIETNREVLQDLRLVSNVLNAVSLLSPGDEFDAMLDIYKEHCDLRPLQELSLCEGETGAPTGASYSGIQPTKYILTRMILAYVKRHQGSPSLVHNYNLYYQHVKEKHPLIAPLAEESYVANAFLLAFGQETDTLKHCTTVVKHMLEFSSSKSDIVGSVAYSAPTVQTWSILLYAFFRNNQRRAAEKVLDMMRERGIRKDRVAWNTMISGYAHSQDVKASVDAVKRMEAAGFDADAFTTKALGRLWIRDRLMQLLQTSREEEPVADQGTVHGLVPPLNSEEKYEASMAIDWESKVSSRADEVRRYLEVKETEKWKGSTFEGGKLWGPETQAPSESRVASAS